MQKKRPHDSIVVLEKANRKMSWHINYQYPFFFSFFFFFKIQVRLQMRRRTLKWTLNLGSKWLNTHVIITPCSPITCLTSNCDNDLMCDSEMSKKCWFLDQINWDLLQHSSSHSKSEIQCILANTYFFVSLCSLNFNSLEPQQPRTIKKNNNISGDYAATWYSNKCGERQFCLHRTPFQWDTRDMSTLED